MGLRRYYIETYGCQMNKAEAESLALQFEQLALVRCESAHFADVVLLNTCSVRKTAEDRIWGRIGHYRYLKKQHPGMLLIITGCMAERLKEELLADKTVDIVIGNFEKNRLGEILTQHETSPGQGLFAEAAEYRFAASHHSRQDFKAFVPIMHGCNNWCSYCIVPHVRGREVSRPPQEILAELTLLEEQNTREVTLLGQNVNSYRFSQGEGILDFPALLRLLSGKMHSIQWVRFLTSHPKDLSRELIEVLAENPLFCKHIHLPVQHGSNKILELMGRGYTREQYLSLVSDIRQSIPDVSLTSDILIGFPGEEPEDFRATLDLMQEVGLDDAFTYKYNPRAGTRAAQLPDSVPEELKTERLARVIELQRALTRTSKSARLGQRVKVLCEGISKKNKFELLGRTEKDEMVVFPGESTQIGNFTWLKLLRLEGNTYYGEEE